MNEIKKLKSEDGVWQFGDENVERLLINYFSELFSTLGPLDIGNVCDVVSGKLSAAHKEWWDHIFTAAEVCEAIDQMHPLKAPGLDGLLALFFQKYWHIVMEDILALVLNILNNSASPEIINKLLLC